jgi:hypothetical protein
LAGLAKPSVAELDDSSLAGMPEPSVAILPESTVAGLEEPNVAWLAESSLAELAEPCLAGLEEVTCCMGHKAQVLHDTWAKCSNTVLVNNGRTDLANCSRNGWVRCCRTE